MIRGARQVGKTYSVRELASSFDKYVEINFEMLPRAVDVFERDLDPERILRDLQILTGQSISPGHTLLFLDEIQEAPKALKALRYFYENLPQQHVIAAGSLVDFQLEHIGVPVGRISFLYMYPMSFLEFLIAKSREDLKDLLVSGDLQKVITETIHSTYLYLLGEYLAVGGMPESVLCWINTSDLKECSAVQTEILLSYQQDFSKYVKSYQTKYTDLLFSEIPKQMGKKFIFSHLPGNYKTRELNPALELLEKANIVQKIYHTDGNGIPLGAEINMKRFKLVFLDIALAQQILHINTGNWILDPMRTLINKGTIAESFVGQELLAYSDPVKKAGCYYWHRETRSSNAEVDYIITIDRDIIPLEVKAGKSGRLRSLHLFIKEHEHCPYGVQLYMDMPAEFGKIKVYPLYAVAGLMKGPVKE